MIENLYRLGTDLREDLFARIEEMGGWPIGFKFVTQRHTTMHKRPCYFGNERIRNEMNTTLYSADEYFWWKLSDEKKAAERINARKQFAMELKMSLDNNAGKLDG